MERFEILLKGSVKAYGHLCPGQEVGVRMAMLGCSFIGLDDPTSRDLMDSTI
jgi:formylmethanofuran dehydrogenase subunit E